MRLCSHRQYRLCIIAISVSRSIFFVYSVTRSSLSSCNISPSRLAKTATPSLARHAPSQTLYPTLLHPSLSPFCLGIAKESMKTEVMDHIPRATVPLCLRPTDRGEIMYVIDALCFRIEVLEYAKHEPSFVAKCNPSTDPATSHYMQLVVSGERNGIRTFLKARKVVCSHVLCSCSCIKVVLDPK